ncbi:ABC transporter ATP-binding protein [Georgenia deserti]|uniref:ABC transporter ATP-binding protein n=1 Tax=Georgenia deserti TaxID=2093781 RepID=A0ABW4L1T8_9MICO
MIRLRDLTKRYPGQNAPAVDRISMDIADGEMVVLVGPSGCGKTTTLKMINRIIEPTAGRIEVGGDDVTQIEVTGLRRRIGYVIQAGGLFPHMTVADNVGIVPTLLGWDKKRIARRSDELLEMVGLDPATYRAQYPQQLSGGQQQRVGVARALAADPPVLLMDEPFGAVDPIARATLQDELLRIQADLHKTIVFVTHDIDEAVKLGDRIAVLQDGARIAQFDRPERLLNAPADEFVERFVGAGAHIRGLSLRRIDEIPLDPPVDQAHDLLALRADESLHTALDRLLIAPDRPLLVTDGAGGVLGSLTMATLLSAVERGHQGSHPTAGDRSS